MILTSRRVIKKTSNTLLNKSCRSSSEGLALKCFEISITINEEYQIKSKLKEMFFSNWLIGVHIIRSIKLILFDFINILK